MRGHGLNDAAAINLRPVGAVAAPCQGLFIFVQGTPYRPLLSASKSVKTSSCLLLGFGAWAASKQCSARQEPRTALCLQSSSNLIRRVAV